MLSFPGGRPIALKIKGLYENDAIWQRLLREWSFLSRQTQLLPF